MKAAAETGPLVASTEGLAEKIEMPHTLNHKTVELGREGPLLRVWLNRSERRNAVNNMMLRESGDLYLSLDQDFDTRVVVLAGAGQSFFAGRTGKLPTQR